MEDLSYFEKAYSMIIEYAPRVIGALVLLIAGLWIIGKASKIISRTLKKRGTDITASKFLADAISVLLKVALLIAIASQLGIETTSFVAIIGAAGLAVGLALQGSLANFAGGVLLLVFKPFKVGDLIYAQGHTGHVHAINIFFTTLITPDNKTAIIPNGPLSNGDITNFTTQGKLRVDLVVGISYSANIQQARDAIMEVMKNDPKVLQDPAPSVSVLELGDSSVNLAVRPYATPANYWDVYFGITEKTKNALDQAGIEIPFPQRVIHQA